jgi:hypothetical protein
MRLFLRLSALSLVVMILVDRMLGARAEFLNAYSVMQRLFGQLPEVGDSLVARQLGATGELAVVLVANLAIGLVLTGIYRWFTRR